MKRSTFDGLHRRWPLLLLPLAAGCASTAAPSAATAPVPQPAIATPAAAPAPPAAPAFSLKDHYTKHEYRIPMRDGVHLFTQVFTPTDTSHPYPFLLNRTPYSVGPYGEDASSDPAPGTSLYSFAQDGFIIVRQDVRGRYMSEGEFVNMTPHKPHKSGPSDIDESTDTYDTIDWLLKNVSNNNGRVGQWGISYPGFYAAAGMIDAHPALQAVSPQAPIGDWFFDDFYHHGAFFLPHYFNFFSGFGKPRPGGGPTTQGTPGFRHPSPDGYQFFLDLGPLKNIETRYYKGEIAFWHDVVAHPSYDRFWQERRILTNLKHVAPAVMTVGGWFDAEDLYGALNTYRAVEDQNPGIVNTLVMGPWAHGAWSRAPGESLGNIHFGGAPSEFFQQNIELPFFKHYLKGDAGSAPPEAYVFETGDNRWRTFDHWPPAGTTARDLYLQGSGALSFDLPPTADTLFDEFTSDPAHPVPYTEAISTGMTREYMTDDQRFATHRPDVLTYQTDVLTEDLTLAGPLTAHLTVSTTGTDADWVVKLIDVFPSDAPEPTASPQADAGARGGRRPRDAGAAWRPMGSYQMMVRSEAFRGRYRHSYEHPEPFMPGKPDTVDMPLQDVLHTFQKGHRLMVQVQSTWFPLMDRNPQKYVSNIFEAGDSDFIKATHRVYRSGDLPTYLRIGVLPAEPAK